MKIPPDIISLPGADDKKVKLAYSSILFKWSTSSFFCTCLQHTYCMPSNGGLLSGHQQSLLIISENYLEVFLFYARSTKQIKFNIILNI